jgi:hypothetical protein
MKKQNLVLGLGLATLLAAGSIAQAANVPPKLEDTCSITGHANEIQRIELVRLANGFYGHRAYDARGRLVCYSEWSLTAALNVQAAEILRAKGDNKANVVDRVFPKSE